MSGFLHSWSGEASNWECDELGHLNMRFYKYKIAEARQMLFLHLGLTHSFKKGATSSIRIDEFHINYLGEALPGAPLRIESAVLELGQTDIRLVHIMYHFDGRPACSVTETVSHVSRRTAEVFSWPKRLIKACGDYEVTLPDIAQSRGIDLSKAFTGPSLETAKTNGMRKLGMGVFRPDEADIFGAIPPEAILGRVTQTIANFTEAWPEMIEEGAGRERAISGALFEGRIVLGEIAQPGDPYVFYSGIAGANANIRTLVHCLYNPFTGARWASMIGVGGLMDLKLRKHMKTPQTTLDALNAAKATDLDI